MATPVEGNPNQFYWAPNRQSRRTHRYRVRVTEFEDYTQRTKRGIRPKQAVYDLAFDRPHAECQNIVDFLDSHVGQTFIFQDPMTGAPMRVRAEDTTVSWRGGLKSQISTRFVEEPMEGQ